MSLLAVPRLRPTLGSVGLWWLLALLLCAQGAWAQNLQPVPALQARVMDLTGTLQAGQRAHLEAKLQAFEQSAGTQIVVLMVRSTQPEDIVDYTQRVGDAWKLGRAQVGDGLLLVIAKDDRALRIAPAKALEGAVPDVAARRIIAETITPHLRRGDFSGGIEAGLDQLMGLVRGEGLPPPERMPGRGGEVDWTGLLVFVFVAVPVGARLLAAVVGRKRGSLLTGAALGMLAWWLSASVLLGLAAGALAAVFALASSLAPARTGRQVRWGGHSADAGWGGGVGRWGSGGGFRSGGGGDFGGGGASGRW